MKFITRSAHSGLRFANTNIVSLMDEQLIIVLRAWGSNEYNQKFIDEVKQYLSSTEADLEVTTPFDYQENLSRSANRTHTAMLLAHDQFYKNENKNEFLVGFEATILFKSKNELAWSSTGRFAIDKLVDNSLHTYLQNGSDLDMETLLPVQLIGLEKSVDINSGSMSVAEKNHVVVSSLFHTRIELKDDASAPQNKINVSSETGTFWLAFITI